MPVRMLDPATFRRMPWKNGGGETIEILAYPDGADLASFDWRISMARVASDGPFSRFDGIDRTLSVLEGGRLVLDFGTGRTVLDPLAAPFPFAGDAAVSGAVPDGPILDLNVMTRRGSCTHQVQRLRNGAAAECHASLALALAWRGTALLETGNTQEPVPEGHAALIKGEAPFWLAAAADGGIAYLVEIGPVRGG
ncbi:MAG: HutD family protein [Beijerinckiaceae bacterium]|nr:HutD family protein [Beijerinckiaceae bacterium]